MINVLVDTDIIIDFLRLGKGKLTELFELQSQQKLNLSISSITVLEVFAGKSSKKNSQDILNLITKMRVLQITTNLAKYAGELKRDYDLQLSFADLLIGVSALSIKAKLATRNRQHFQGIPRLKFL